MYCCYHPLNEVPQWLLPRSQCLTCTSVSCVAPWRRLRYALSAASAPLFAWWGMQTHHARFPRARWKSVLGRSCVFQHGSNVQQGVFHSLGEPGGVCLLAAVEGRDGDVDVLFHGVVTHAVAVGHHRTEAHHAVGLGAHLKRTQMRKMGLKSKIRTCSFWNKVKWKVLNNYQSITIGC